MKIKKKYLLGVIALILLFAIIITVSRCERKEKYTSSYFNFFDSFATLTVYTESQKYFDVYDNIFNTELERYHKLLDIYNSYDGVTNLCSLNESAGTGEISISHHLFDFLVEAKKMYSLTDGYTSIALGAVTSIWKEAIESKTLPDEQALAEAAEHTNIDDIKLDDLYKTVNILDSELRIDAGALGKGYVSDIICEALLEAGCESFLINIGGTLTGFGHKANGDQWYGGIQNSNGEELDISLNISGASIATSGSYHRGFELDGVTYHHIINPTTFHPENIYTSVSIVSRSAMEADALSTALFSMSAEQGKEIVRSLEYTGAMWQYADGTTESTEGFDDLKK